MTIFKITCWTDETSFREECGLPVDDLSVYCLTQAIREGSQTWIIKSIIMQVINNGLTKDFTYIKIIIIKKEIEMELSIKQSQVERQCHKIISKKTQRR